jgi:hypothetical protein
MLLVQAAGIVLIVIILLLVTVKVRDVRVRRHYDKGFWEVLSSPPGPYVWQTWALIIAAVVVLLFSGSLFGTRG